MNLRHQILLQVSLGIGLSSISAQDPFVFDSTLSATLPQSIANSIEIGDVNNDGLNDILLTGYDSTRFGVFLDVISGTNNGSFDTYYSESFVTYPDTIAERVGGLGGLDIIDFNRDGELDVYFHGSAQSRLMINDNNTFNQSTDIETMFLTYSDGQWGDINMDGAPDLMVMGADETQDIIINNLFMNNGERLDKDYTTVFPDLFTGSSTWGDYDNDGDPDLLMCGQTADKTASVTRFYQNEPTGRLIEDTNQDIIGLKGGVLKFSDLDNDGDQDLIVTGWNKLASALVTHIYENEPLGTFTNTGSTINFGVVYGSIDVIDYDLDGLKDLVISGADSVSSHAGVIHSLKGQIYKNNGNFDFILDKEIPGARSIRFFDANIDSIPDIIVNGTTEFGNSDSTFTHIYLNTTDGTNSSPEAPSALTAFAVSTRAIFTWGQGSDDINDANALAYNIRIGTTSGGNELLSGTSPMGEPNIGQLLIREFHEIPHGTYYWAVQTIDPTGLASEWSQEETLFISRLVTSTQSLPGVYFSTAGWADYNEDELLDLALTGILFSGNSITNLFQNEDELLNQDLSQSIEAVFGGHLSWVDYTNDGHLDLSLSGFQIINFQGFPATAFYKYENGTYVFDEQENVTTNISGYTMGYNGGSNNHDWGDYDNDGDLDFVIGGIDFNGVKHLKVFKNNNGILVEDTTQSVLSPIFPAMVKWVDINTDGYLDLVTIGADTNTTVGLRCYLNNSNYTFSTGLTWDTEIYGVTAGAFDFADYNSDGLDDFALTGLNNNNKLVSYIVTNSNQQFIVASKNHDLYGVYYGRPTWGDYDSDGDLDLLVSGLSDTTDGGSVPYSALYTQNDGEFTIDESIQIDSVGFSFSQFGDYDNDGDLDLFLAGITPNSDVIAKVYDNLEGITNPNKSPNSPYGLDDSEINDSQVTLSWVAPIDPDNDVGSSTPTSGLRYQIQIGSTDSNNEHEISTGHYGVGQIGSISRLEKIVRDIPEGNYSWRVRAIDHGTAKSDWSSTDYFYIDVTPPTIDTIRTNYVSNKQIILVIKFEEDFYLDLSTNPSVLVTHPDFPDLDNDGLIDSLIVEQQSYNGDEWTGVLMLPDSYSGKAIQVHVSGAKDDRNNVMPKTSIFKTPDTIISQLGGTAISEDGNVSILIPQGGFSQDYSLHIELTNTPPLSDSTILLTNLYAITPSEISLNKPGLLRIALPFESPDDATPFIGKISSRGDPIPLGGSQISINEKPFLQVQIDQLGNFGVFETTSPLEYDSLDVESLVCQPRIFSPKGSVFEFTQTNILFDLQEPQKVTARIFNLAGRLKRIIEPEFSTQPGHQVLNWDGKDSQGNIVPSGLYIVTLEKDDTILKTTVGVLNR